MATNDGHNRRSQVNRAFYDAVSNMISPFANHEPGDVAITFDTDPPANYELVRLPHTDIDNWSLLGSGTGGAGPGGAVTSFNARTGDVVPAAGDYGTNELTNDSTLAGTTVTDVFNNLPSVFIPISQKGAVNGVAALDGTGKVPTSQLPPLEVTASVSVANTAARLALPGTDATMAFQLDTGDVWFIGAGLDKSVSGNWGLVAGVTAGVASFNTRTGNVVPAAGDYTATQITNTPAGNIASVTVQGAINELDTEKLPLSHAGSGGSAHALVTTSVAGFMSAADKTKLDGIPGGTIPALTSTAPQSVGTVNTLGTSTEAARADHVHAHGAQGGGTLHAEATTSTPGFMSAADKTKLNAYPADPSGFPVLSSTVPAAVAAAGAVGVGTTAARADHVHAHGDQSGGTLHALATTSVAGFLSNTDKAKLDAYPATPAGLPASGITQLRMQRSYGIGSYTDVTYAVLDDTLAGGDSGVLAIDFGALSGSANANIGIAANFGTVPVMIGAAAAGPGLLVAPGQVNMGQIHGASLATVTSAAGTDLLLRRTSANVYGPITVDNFFTNRTVTTPTVVTPVMRAPRYTGVAAVTSGTAVTLSAETNGHDRTVTLTGNATITLPAATTTANAVTYFTVRLVQDATGSRTVTWAPPAGDTIAWDGSASAPTINTAANSTTIVGFIKHQGSTVWRGSRLFLQN